MSLNFFLPEFIELIYEFFLAGKIGSENYEIQNASVHIKYERKKKFGLKCPINMQFYHDT